MHLNLAFVCGVSWNIFSKWTYRFSGNIYYLAFVCGVVEIFFPNEHTGFLATFIEMTTFSLLNYFDNFTKISWKYTWGLLLNIILFRGSICLYILMCFEFTFSYFNVFSGFPCYFFEPMRYLEICCSISKYLWIFQTSFCYWYLL